jgi:hypothetical protein
MARGRPWLGELARGAVGGGPPGGRLRPRHLAHHHRQGAGLATAGRWSHSEFQTPLGIFRIDDH